MRTILDHEFETVSWDLMSRYPFQVQIHVYRSCYRGTTVSITSCSQIEISFRIIGGGLNSSRLAMISKTKSTLAKDMAILQLNARENLTTIARIQTCHFWMQKTAIETVQKSISGNYGWFYYYSCIKLYCLNSSFSITYQFVYFILR